jgi:hypothetical protein
LALHFDPLFIALYLKLNIFLTLFILLFVIIEDIHHLCLLLERGRITLHLKFNFWLFSWRVFLRNDHELILEIFLMTDAVSRIGDFILELFVLFLLCFDG